MGSDVHHFIPSPKTAAQGMVLPTEGRSSLLRKPNSPNSNSHTPQANLSYRTPQGLARGLSLR